MMGKSESLGWLQLMVSHISLHTKSSHYSDQLMHEYMIYKFKH